ncbi:MAG: CoA transferase [Dehalococcoidales bacterium]|nr:MAG: CoA transferase [Dehalococcoidales bacterium]
MGKQAFENLKVLDLTEGIAGPYCTKLLADFGAEVIKIEKPGTGDWTRSTAKSTGDTQELEKSGTFFYLNTSKKSVTLDIWSEEGFEILKELVKDTSVMVESFEPGQLAELGLTEELLKELNPKLIITSISAYGQTGPYRDYKATNFTVYAAGGAMYTQRPGTRPMDRPVVEGGYQAEYSTGLLAYIATVSALIKRNKTEKGMSIDISAMESVASTLMGHVAEYSYLGLSRRTSPFAIHGYPIGYSVPCKDGWISLTPGVGGAPNIAFLIEQPELQDNPLLADTRIRMANPEKLDELMTPWLQERGKWEVTRAAQELRLAFTPVLNPEEVMNDEQIKAREFFTEAEHPVMGKVKYPGAPAKLNGSPWQAGRAPLLGEHNEEVFGNIGYDEEKLSELEKKGII